MGEFRNVREGGRGGMRERVGEGERAKEKEGSIVEEGEHEEESKRSRKG